MLRYIFTIILQYIKIPDWTGEKFSANQMPGRPSDLSDRPAKHKSGRGRWDVAPCQVLFNSVKRYQRGSRKRMSQSETRAASYIYSYIVPRKRVFSFCRVFSFAVIWNWCHLSVWPISIGQTAKWHPYHMITLWNTWQNENTLSHVTI